MAILSSCCLCSVRIILVLDRLKDNPRYEDSFFTASRYSKFDDKVNLTATMSYRERVASFCKCMIGMIIEEPIL